jgi:hypothetical protein
VFFVRRDRRVADGVERASLSPQRHSRLPSFVEISQAGENDATQLLFVVAAFRHERECECRIIPGIHRKLSVSGYLWADDRTRLQDLRGFFPRPRFAISASLS